VKAIGQIVSVEGVAVLFQFEGSNRIYILSGDGFMDFIHRPKSKILKNIKKFKIKTTSFRKLALLPCSGEWRGRTEEHLLSYNILKAEYVPGPYRSFR
jgi:hypothetical protein